MSKHSKVIGSTKDRGHFRLYRTPAGRASAVTQMVKRGVWNYFVGYLDANARRPFGLSVGIALWAKTPHVKDV